MTVTAISQVQQLLTMDESEGASIGQAWLEGMVEKLGLKGKPGSEIKCERVKDTNVTTLWYRQQPVAIIIRQRNDYNWTATTLVELMPILETHRVDR